MNKKVLVALWVAVLVVLPLVADGLLGNAWVRILCFMVLSAMLALGLNVVVGMTGLLDLGYIAFYAVGAYLFAILASPQMSFAFPEHFPDGVHISLWLLLPLAALLACAAGVLLGSPALRLHGDYLAIVTLGFGEIVRIFMNNLNDPVNLTGGPQGITPIDSAMIFGHSLKDPLALGPFSLSGNQQHYYLFLVAAALIVWVNYRLLHSRIGLAWEALREDETAARAMGINPRRYKLLAFAIGASFGGVSGAFFASFQGFVSPESFGLWESFMVLAMVVLGGMGNVWGVIGGAVLLTLIPEVLRFGLGPLEKLLFGREIVSLEVVRMMVFGLVMILVMRFRPQGLWPAHRGLRPKNKEH